MADAIRLYTGPLSMFGTKAEIALAEKGLPFERVEVAYNGADGYLPHHPDVVRVNPKGQVPILIHGDLEIFDSTQIFEYVEDIAPAPPLWPADVRERARARLLEHGADEVFFPHVIRLMGLQDRLTEPAALAEIAAIQAYALGLEQRLDDRDWLGSSYSYADIAFYMTQLFAERMGAPLTEATPKLMAWRRRMGERAAVRPVIWRLAGYLRSNQRVVPPHLQATLASGGHNAS